MKKRLLLADDSVTIQKVVQITFSHDDYELTVVDNGDIAYEKAKTQRPDLILADVFMPGKNGYELCAAVKNDPSLSSVPVLLLTGTFEPFDEAKARSVGADRWIAKPFESQSLISCVEDLLSHAAQAPPVVVAAAPAAAAPAAAAPIVETPAEEIASDIWSAGDFSNEVPSVSLDPFGEESVPLAGEDDLWDAKGFEADIQAPAAATSSDDLWGSFEPTSITPVETVNPAADLPPMDEADVWGVDDLATSFVSPSSSSSSAVVTPEEIPFSDEVEVLEEIDLLDSAAAPVAVSAVDEDPFSGSDFSFEDEVTTPVTETPPVIAAVAAPIPVPEVEPPAQSVAMPSSSEFVGSSVLNEDQLNMIVDRVADVVISRLSDTLLEKIAWEVVPDLAETMIKEELRKIRQSVIPE